MTRIELAAVRGVELGVIHLTTAGRIATRPPHGLAADDLEEANRIIRHLSDHQDEVLAAAERVFASRRHPPVRFE